MAYTKGPWVVSIDSIVHLESSTGPHGAGYSVAEMYHVQDADLSLIVAAPDLLEACKNALTILDKDTTHVKNEDMSAHHKTIEALKKAIAKAQLQSPKPETT